MKLKFKLLTAKTLKKPLQILVGCLLFFSPITAQDLFDFGHTQSYARHLMRSKKFDLAAAEYQRLVFMEPRNDTFKIQLLKSYRLGAMAESGIAQWQIWNTETALPNTINFEYAKILLSSGHEKEAIVYAATPGNLNEWQGKLIGLYANTLLLNWSQTDLLLQEWPPNLPLPNRNALQRLSVQGKKLPYKSPALAATLSAVLPGSGKAYTNNWADGAIGLVFVGLNTWQAWRRFDREGTASVWGWVHTGFAAGFYIGNIYGSHKAARIFNNRQKHRIRHEAERYIFPALD